LDGNVGIRDNQAVASRGWTPDMVFPPSGQRVDLFIALSAPPPVAYVLSMLTNMLNGQRQGEKQRNNSGLALPGSSPFVSATTCLG
jgi:hypothetical protein